MESIHDRALQIASRFKKNQSDLIDIIQEIDSQKAFYEKGFKSTYEYCMKYLNLSDDLTLDFIAISRKAKTVPELKEAIKKEIITVSKARRLTPVIDQKNSAHWLELAQNLSKDKLQKEIARVNPQVLTPEKAKYVTENRLKLELGVSEEIMEDLKRVQEILSQKTKSFVSFEVALETALKELLKKEDPLKKAERVMGKKGLRGNKQEQLMARGEKRLNANKQGQFVGMEKKGLDGNKQDQLVVNDPGQGGKKSVYGPGRIKSQSVQIPFKRVKPTASLEHQVILRDQGQCTFEDSSQQRCSERKWLHIHHIIPISQGGQNELNNLKTLCFAHHQMKHPH